METPILAWLKLAPSPPARPNLCLFHCPDVATSTAPGAVVSDGSQQSILVSFVVEGIAGRAHHVAVRNESPPSSEDTICHGGTCRAEGLEISTTPDESVSLVAVVFFDLTPSASTSCLISAGPPLL